MPDQSNSKRMKKITTKALLVKGAECESHLTGKATSPSPVGGPRWTNSPTQDTLLCEEGNILCSYSKRQRALSESPKIKFDVHLRSCSEFKEQLGATVFPLIYGDMVNGRNVHYIAAAKYEMHVFCTCRMLVDIDSDFDKCSISPLGRSFHAHKSHIVYIHLPPEGCHAGDCSTDLKEQCNDRSACFQQKRRRRRYRRRGHMKSPISYHLSIMRQCVRTLGSPCAKAETKPKQETYHIGKHSVDLTDVTHTKMVDQSDKTGQNAIVKLSNALTQDADSVTRNALFNWDITAHLTGPSSVGPPRNGDVVSTFQRYTVPAVAIQPTTVSFTAPQREDMLPQAAAKDYMNDTTLKPKFVTDALQGTVNFNRATAERVAPKLLTQMVRYDISALFAVAYIVYAMRRDQEASNIAPAVPAAVGNNVVVRTVDDAVPANANANATGIVSDMEAGRFILDKRDLSDEDINVLQLIAAGPQALNGVPGGPNSVIGSIVTPPILWSLLCEGAFVVPPMVDSTSLQILSTINKLGSVLCATTSQLKGFMRASTIVNGSVRPCGPLAARLYRYYTSTIEFNSVTLPTPRAHNFMWHLLGIEPARMDAPYFNEDVTQLRSLEPLVLDKTMIGVAGLMSIGVSSVFQTLNITGRELNSLGAAGGAVAQAANLIRSLICKGSGDRASILRLACGLIGQISTIVINPSTVLSPTWANQAIGVQAWAANEAWQGAFGLTIPYLVDPLCMAWLFDKWSHLWGVSAAGPSFDFHEELQTLGAPPDNGWYAEMGCDDYFERVKSTRPFSYIAYGSAAMTLQRQHLTANALNWDVTFSLYVKSGQRWRQLGVDAAAALQPQWDFDLQRMIPGTMLTFDWVRMAVLAPSIRQNAYMVNRFNTLKSMDKVTSLYAGVLIPHSYTQENVVADLSQLGDLISGLDIAAQSDPAVNKESATAQLN